MLKLTLFLTLAVTVLSNSIPSALNRSFRMTCPEGQVIDKAQSVFNKIKGDRQWSFRCRNNNHDVFMTTCSWTGWVNNYKEPILFQCNGDGIIAGLYRDYNSKMKARRYKFYCCEFNGYVAHACNFTKPLNRVHGPLDAELPPETYLRGVESVPAGKPQDRQWRFDICKLDKINTGGGGGGAVIG